MENNCNISIELATELGNSVEEAGGIDDFSRFLIIRREMNHFLLNLNHSNRADGTGQQIHFLFVALAHLDNVEKEIRISGAAEGVIRVERIHDKIRSLKILILNYIRHLTSES
ncbi:hypothetical protein ACFLTU_03730 [Bacteroidota bacterium]